MITKEVINAIDTQIANLQMNTEKVRADSFDYLEKYDCLIKSIAYQECRNIILMVIENSK